ncbi:selenoneine synthase SenA, partial [Ramlibacter sp.]|uniref:selenoneine synthase SenA n=1 Tax=Ramlibacter sp. TaxID=1917967 RepID=UPI00182E1201
RAALLAARQRTLRLARAYQAALGPAACIPYAAEVNPPLWELGHLAWFQEWWIARNPQRALGARADPDAPRPAPLLAQADAWYDSSRVPHRSRWELPLPDGAGALGYLEATLSGSVALLDDLPDDAGDDALYFFRLCAMHEQMHAEAAVYMARTLGVPLEEDATPGTAGAPREIDLPAQRFRLGFGGSGFAFDNELGAHDADLQAFAIDAEPVTWGAYLPFVRAGGYEDLQWWSDAGRAWLSGLPRRGPAGWQAGAPDDAVAVHLTAHEADAWCRWAGRRLPTEAEWECAALQGPGFRWGQVWEWTASTFWPYPGFTAHPYRDYSQPWFGTRRVLRGASAATDPAMAHARYRNFFEPHRRDTLAGFRSVRADAEPARSVV